MKQTLDLKQHSFFNHHHFLELEGLIKDTDAEKLLELTQGKSLQKSRDFFTRDEWIRSISMRKSYSHLAKEIFQCRFLRLAFDQAIQTSNKEPSSFKEKLSLNECCSFQSLSGALILRLTQTAATVEANETLLCPLPQKRGNGIFFSADIPINWETLFSLPEEAFLLIAYCPLNTVYIQNPDDLFTNLLKSEGYGFGDRLREDRHPILK